MNPDAHDEHVEAAVELQHRGLFDWCREEFELRIQGPVMDPVKLRTRYLYADILHDGRLDYEQASAVLAPIVEQLERDASSEAQVRGANLLPSRIRREGTFFAACTASNRNNTQPPRKTSSRRCDMTARKSTP